MRVCFVGLGSIAERHIRNLKDILGADIVIDVLRSGIGRSVESDLATMINNIFYCVDEMQGFYDAVFITNPTSKHFDTLIQLQNFSNYFFVEKPVFENWNEKIELLDQTKTYYVACPLRYTNVIQHLKQNVDFSEVYSMRCISSSYLPNWRPGTDYRNTYSAHRNLGGGVSIDLIHEWDYIHYLLGEPKQVKSIISKKSHLEIDSDDIAIYIAEYEDKVVELHLDYFGRKSIRRIELFTKNDTIVADLINQKIECLYTGIKYDMSQERNEYQKKELKHFLDIIQGKVNNDNGLLEACSVLKITKGC